MDTKVKPEPVAAADQKPLAELAIYGDVGSKKSRSGSPERRGRHERSRSRSRSPERYERPYTDQLPEARRQTGTAPPKFDQKERYSGGADVRYAEYTGGIDYKAAVGRKEYVGPAISAAAAIGMFGALVVPPETARPAAAAAAAPAVPASPPLPRVPPLVSAFVTASIVAATVAPTSTPAPAPTPTPVAAPAPPAQAPEPIPDDVTDDYTAVFRKFTVPRTKTDTAENWSKFFDVYTKNGDVKLEISGTITAVRFVTLYMNALRATTAWSSALKIVKATTTDQIVTITKNMNPQTLAKKIGGWVTQGKLRTITPAEREAIFARNRDFSMPEGVVETDTKVPIGDRMIPTEFIKAPEYTAADLREA